MRKIIKKLLREALVKEENIFTSIEKNSIGALDFKGENNLKSSVWIDNSYNKINGEIIPIRNMDVYRMDSPSDPNNAIYNIERQGYGTKMLTELIQYCKYNNIEYIGSKSLNDKSFGLFKKFENNGILIPVESGLHKRTILWKINN